MEVKDDSYRVWYEKSDENIYFKGSLRLPGSEDYEPILALLNQVVSDHPSVIKLDLKELEFLNSSGISMLSKFVINMRKLQTVQIAIKGSNAIPWQGKSLKNLQRLMPNLQLDLE